jgi:hypothetical protein
MRRRNTGARDLLVLAILFNMALVVGVALMMLGRLA